MSSCGSCAGGRLSFGRRGNPQAAAAMRLKYSQGISLKAAWAKVKGGKVRVGRRRKSRRSRKRRGSKRRRSRSRRRRSRRFGIVAGPGYAGQTSYSNAYAPYFGASEPFVNASDWWYPQANGQIQSPMMLMTKPLAGFIGPSN